MWLLLGLFLAIWSRIHGSSHDHVSITPSSILSEEHHWCIFDLFPSGAADVGGHLPFAVRITGCHSDPCTFVVGEKIHVYVDFNVYSEMKEARTVVNIIDANNTRVNYPLDENNQNACNRASARCPLYAGQNILYKLELPIERLRLHTDVDRIMQIGLRDQNNKMTVCFQFGTIFVKPIVY